MSESLKIDAMKIIHAAIDAVRPSSVMRQKVSLEGGSLRLVDLEYDLKNVRRLCVLGAGKASAAMAAILEEILGNRISDGCIVTKYGHGIPTQHVPIREAGHPVVDQQGLDASREILHLAESLNEDDLAIVLISGGASALLEQFPDSIPLSDAQSTFDLLLKSGADITEMNALRKHISRVKGGQLARVLAPCPSLTLLISDVIGDSLDVIGSGPTAPDPSRFPDAWAVLERYRLVGAVPRSIRDHLQDGLRGEIPETPKQDDPSFRLTRHRILASNKISLEAARSQAAQLGYDARIVSSAVTGEPTAVARMVSEHLKNAQNTQTGPICLIYGGEMTVTVRGTGKGGRCQEFAVAALECNAGLAPGHLIAAVGTDGTDGPTDAAGGIVTAECAARSLALGLSVEEHLNRNDSYSFLNAIDSLVFTGPTGTNVMDVMIAMRE